MKAPLPKNFKNGFYFYHTVYSPVATSFFQQNNFKGLMIYRDPRDQVVSLAFHVLKDAPNQPAFLEHYPAHLVTGKSLSPLIQHVITKISPRYYSAFLPWIHDPLFCPVRFENLVGRKGGGSTAKQVEEIKKIAAHLEVPLTTNRLGWCLKNIFGQGVTFRAGQIGSWRKHFTAEDKALFKQSELEEVLIALGYEKDHNW